MSASNPDALRKVFLEVNSSLPSRAAFLNDPVGYLSNAGIHFDASIQSEISAVVLVTKQTVPAIANLPGNFGPIAMNVSGLPTETGQLVERTKRLRDLQSADPPDDTFIL